MAETTKTSQAEQGTPPQWKPPSYIMPETTLESLLYAFITIIFTVLGFVFYTLYVVEGKDLKEATGQKTVAAAIKAQGGVYMFGTTMPVWALILIEIGFAFLLETTWVERCVFKLASRHFDPMNTHPKIFLCAIICSTVCLMCPSMSLIAAFLYYPYYDGFHILTALANWLVTFIHNFPFAFFAQIFFIQPLMHSIWRLFFTKSRKKKALKIAAYETNKDEIEASKEITADLESTKGSPSISIEISEGTNSTDDVSEDWSENL